MKLSETKSLLKDLRALSVEELTTREAELKKNCLIFVSKLLLVVSKTQLSLTKSRKLLHV